MLQKASTIVLALLLSISTAQAANWTVDATHSRAGFRVSHMMVSSVEGSFSDMNGELDYEVGKLKGLTVKITIAVDSVDTANADRDTHLKSPEFFDTTKFPTMGFVSKKVKPTKSGFDLTGDLTIRGVTRRVTFEATGLTQSMIDPWGNTRVGASATTTINRQDFGVSWNKSLDQGGLVVGDEVELRLDLEFVKAK